MFQIRTKFRKMCQTIAAMASSSANAEAGSVSTQSKLARVIHLRETKGQTTTLRQLHKVTDLSQADALRAIREMEQSGLVEILHDMHDEFESTIIIKQQLRDTLKRR